MPFLSPVDERKYCQKSHGNTLHCHSYDFTWKYFQNLVIGQKIPLRLDVRRENEWIAVHVTDMGPGISREILEMLFTPFFTTKHDGMGMGLAICRSIVEFHHGRLSAGSAAAGGAEMSFVLPIIAA
jgi:signal transduction histidine kinase